MSAVHFAQYTLWGADGENAVVDLNSVCAVHVDKTLLGNSPETFAAGWSLTIVTLGGPVSVGFLDPNEARQARDGLLGALSHRGES